MRLRSRRRLGIGIEGLDVFVNGVVEFEDGAECAALESPSGEGGEEALDGVEPGRRGRGEVENSKQNDGLNTHSQDEVAASSNQILCVIERAHLYAFR